ncbi:serine/threonine protein kinase [Aquihabitans sp. G128]|uniref:serine/threonine-protein kinase n=1 Tax=Aquihabitans sp. G128 TaxID=2849779 RepID=UPI001C21EC57|nr:serine/threonine-protein kinase [Aquihabitans sp. G128]QXC62476.1 serine/threonine protein kinase [Aquihabitans sp. G128]
MAEDEPAHGPLLAGRYRVGRLLAAGGMADVHCGHDERLHRDVAIKVLRAPAGGALADDATARHRFAAEGRTVARLAHPRIVTLFDAGEDGEAAFLVMELLSGATLRDRLGRGPLDETEAVQVLDDVLGALDAAHRAGIIHRDIKPSNVLADVDGGWKVADFGIARSSGPTPDQDLTQTGLVVGTPRYLAPERLSGQPASVASDLYSVGVLLGEVIGDGPQRSPRLAAIASRATATDPRQRFASAASMADAIHGRETVATVAALAAATTPTLAAPAADGTTVVAAPPPTQVLPLATRLPADRRKRRVAVAAAIAVLAAGAVAIGLADRGPSSTPPRSDQAPASSTTTLTTVPASTTTAVPPTTVAPTTVAVTTAPAPPATKAPKPPKGKGKGKPKG